MDITTAFWGMVINNYDETDLALVQQGYPDFIRQLVYTKEVGGENGTPHIQAYLKLYRQQRLSYVKKLFPRGNFKPLLADDYKLNAQRYAQKLDATADSSATINNNPFPDPVVELTSVIETVMTESLTMDWEKLNEKMMMFCVNREEHHRVSKSPRLAKFYVSSTYKNIKKEFWRAIAKNIADTHTHTHDEKIISHGDSINKDGEDDEESWQDGTDASGGSEEDGEDYEDGSGATDEGYSEGSGSILSSQDD